MWPKMVPIDAITWRIVEDIGGPLALAAAFDAFVQGIESDMDKKANVI